MKKILYSTTALAAAGLLALTPMDAMAQKKAKKKVSGDKIKLKIGGYFETRLSWADQEGSYEAAVSTGWDNFNVINDSEIYFSGSTQLDNGIKISTSVQLETDWAQTKDGGNTAGTTAVIDESYIKFSGGFGELRIGNTPMPAFYMDVHAPSTGIQINSNPDALDLLIKPAAVWSGGGGSRNVTIGKGDDDLKLAYRSPKFGGFQLGVGYKPDDGNGDTVPQVGGSADTSVGRKTSVALSYGGKIGDVGVKIGVDWSNTAGATSSGDSKLFHTGAEVSFAGFRIGGEYGNNQGGHGTNASLTSSDVWGWDVGVSYATGPWTVAANYYYTEHEGLNADPDDDETTQYGIQARYKLGPGVYVGANLNHIDWEDETTTNANNNNGWMFVTGLRVSF